VRVADAHAELRLLAAHLADGRHDETLAFGTGSNS
jgi:hypothetical protein